MCELCEVERCSGACVLFDYEDHTVCRILYVIIFNIQYLLQRKVKAADEDENDDNNKASKKKKGKPKKKSKKK